MTRSGEITAAEAKRVLRSYWWTLPLGALVCGVLGLLLAVMLPKRYASETSVLIDQSNVGTEYLKVIDDLNRRLASMQEQILSRASLEPIIDKFGLYAKYRGRAPMDELVGRLRDSVNVKPLESMPGIQNQNLPGFYVDVTFDDPRTAQKICAEITSMFMGENAREREENAAQATSFLSGQVKSAKEKLDKENAKLAAFKGQYLGSLPEEEQTNLNLLMASNSQLEANVQALSRAQQSKAFNESLLTQQEAVAAMSGTGQNPEAAEQQLSALQDQLTSLLARYTPQHPDVIRTQNQIEELKTRMREIPSEEQSRESTKRVPAESSQIQQLRAKLRQDELSIADLTKRQGKIQDQIRLLQERLQASPVVEQQLKEITRNYQAALDFYDDLLKKREQSAMVSDLERKQESGRFRVLDPPSLPSKPSFPKRRYFAGGGAGVGLALAFGLMYLIAVTDKSMYTQAEVEFWLKLPVLVSVPKLEMLQNDASELLAEGLSIRS